ncbi:hypothetical protein GCM10017767_07370 [Halomonas urumqiensis]|nr:hypothetical protein GCM10017767_07370 [Halomonas urumqiensis]
MSRQRQALSTRGGKVSNSASPAQPEDRRRTSARIRDGSNHHHSAPNNSAPISGREYREIRCQRADISATPVR